MLMDEFGKDAYFYYFAIIEVCCQKKAVGEDLIFHESFLRKELMTGNKNLNKILEKMKSLSILDFELKGKIYKLDLSFF